MDVRNPASVPFVRHLQGTLPALVPTIDAAVPPNKPASKENGALATLRNTFLASAIFVVRLMGKVPPGATRFCDDIDRFLCGLIGVAPFSGDAIGNYFQDVLAFRSPLELDARNVIDLWMMRGLEAFDLQNRTQITCQVRDLVWQHASGMLAGIDPNAADADACLDELTRALNGESQWALFAIQPTSLELFQECETTIEGAREVVELSMRNVWSAEHAHPPGDTLLAGALWRLTIHLFLTLGGASEAGVRFIRDFGWFFPKLNIRPPNDRLSTWRLYMEIITEKPTDDDREPDFTMLYLEDLGTRAAMQHAEHCRTMCERFAAAFLEADGQSGWERERRLHNLRRFIRPPTPTPVAQPASPVTPTVAAPLPLQATDGPKAADELMAELNAMVGLESVKQEVRQLVNFLKVQSLRAARGLRETPMSRHLVFSGNPGTGKTTVARLLASIYRSLGVLSRGHLVEIDRAGLVAGFLGQTALKVREVVNGALGGILFIDEAYTLIERNDDSFGREAIDTLLKMMEDHRGDLIVVVAGYTDRMSTFLSANPGMKSRFNRYIHFDDYRPDELALIFERFCVSSGFLLSEDAAQKLRAVVDELFARRDETFGNGRLARNLFEQSVNNHASRVVCLAEIDETTLSTICSEDIPDGMHPVRA